MASLNRLNQLLNGSQYKAESTTNCTIHPITGRVFAVYVIKTETNGAAKIVRELLNYCHSFGLEDIQISPEGTSIYVWITEK